MSNKLVRIALVLFLSPLFLTSNAGCAWFKHEAAVAKADLIDCAKADLGQTVEEAGMSLAMTVAMLVFQAPTGWQDVLHTLEAKYGMEAVACAEKLASDLFKPPPSMTPQTGEHVESPYDRAQKSLSGKKFR